MQETALNGLVDFERKITVLHVEDDDGDAYLTQRAFQAMASSVNFVRVSGGQDALQFLNRTGPYVDAPQVHCVLLDINMANGDGLWLLEHMALRSSDRVIPTIILSGDPDNVVEARKFPFVSCAIVKPDTQLAFERLMDTVRKVTLLSMGKAA
jgi:CheY-like chemotaxis protein